MNKMVKSIVASLVVGTITNVVFGEVTKMRQIVLDSKSESYERPVYLDYDMPAAIKMVETGESFTGFWGFGASLTGSSCYNLSKMKPEARTELLKKIFTKTGVNLSVARLTIGSSDYSPELYSYAEVPNDMELKHFSIEKDEEYIIPMIKEVIAICPTIKLYAAPWSPPRWMKTGGNICGGYMREKYLECYANYFVRYLQEYEKRGIHISAVSPQNEQDTQQGGRMPACMWHPELEAKFVRILREKLKAAGLKTEIWMYDHNFNGVERVRWTLNEEKGVRESVQGLAFHYYEGVVEETFALRKEYPELNLHFTESFPPLDKTYEIDWCKWGLMISRAIACGYRSFSTWNLLLDEKGEPCVSYFDCAGFFTYDTQTEKVTMSGQAKAFRSFARIIEQTDKVVSLREKYGAASNMLLYPEHRCEMRGVKVTKLSGKEYCIFVNPNKEKAQTSFEANGKRWYIELPADSISVVEDYDNTVVRYLYPDDYMADPSAHIFNGRLFIYPSHDKKTDNPPKTQNNNFAMDDYCVLEILPDKNGKLDPMTGKVVNHGVIFSLKDIPWAKYQLWACDAAEKDGKFYHFFCAKDKDDLFRLGVAVADRPEGPFKPCDKPIAGGYSIDPCVFKDPKDGAYYIAFGGLWGGQLQRFKDNKHVNNDMYESKNLDLALCPKIAKLSDDMLSLAEEPRDLVLTDEKGSPLKASDNARRFFEASWMYYKDGLYHFSYSTGDTHMICDAVSENVRGPYRYNGVILDPQIGWSNHHSVIEINKKWWVFHHDSSASGGITALRTLKVAPLKLH